MLLTNNLHRNETVPQLLNELRGMIYNFARAYQLDFDDCFQDAAIIALEVWPRIPVDCANVGAYLNRCIRGELYRRLRKDHTVSLDAPIAEDSDTTFADMLADFVEVQDTQREDFVTACVHAALKECRLQEQQWARRRFEMNAFNPVPSTSGLKDMLDYYGRSKDRSGMSLRNSVRLRFKRNPQVLALMQ